MKKSPLLWAGNAQRGEGLILFIEVQDNGVDAEPLSGGSRSIFKEVTQVTVTAGTDHFGPLHPLVVVRLRPDALLGDG